MSRFRGYTKCANCQGSRLRSDALQVFIANKNITDIVLMTLEKAFLFFNALHLPQFEKEISSRLLLEIKKRLKYLVDVGIGYLTLDRLSQIRLQTAKRRR